jgi:alpha/beta superfamily hydrolase
MNPAIRTATLVLALLAFTAPAFAEAVTLPTRPGVTVPFSYLPAPSPTRSVILFTGASGVVAATRNNFLLRVADRFVAAGFSVAIADVPSDHATGLPDEFRAGPDNAVDIAAIAAFLQQRAAVPVWLIGTSRGTISAAAAAARIGPPRIAGLVLTSTVWRAGDFLMLDQIQVPTLIVHNRDDGCAQSPFSSASAGLAGLRAAPAKDLVAVSGGTSKSGPCEALSPHGYYGIESQVVPAIIDWIKAH